MHINGWLGCRVVSVLDSGAEGPGFKSQPRRCRVTVLGKLFTPIVPLFTNRVWATFTFCYLPAGLDEQQTVYTERRQQPRTQSHRRTHHVDIAGGLENASGQQNGKQQLVLLKQTATDVAVEAVREVVVDVATALSYVVFTHTHTHTRFTALCPVL